MSSSDSISFDSPEESLDVSTENLSEPISTSVNQSTPCRKRSHTAKGTWEHSRKPEESEPECGGPRKNLLQILHKSNIFNICLNHLSQPLIESSFV
jgi:hypothetical protein